MSFWCEGKPITKREYQHFIRKMYEQNPDFVTARKLKKAIRESIYIKKLIERNVLSNKTNEPKD